MGCGWWNPPTPYKEDCYWYREEQDMNTRIPYCTCKNQFPLNTCENCEDYHSRSKRTQGDRIRSMTDEDLADWFSIYCCRNKTYDAHCDTFRNCKACWADWLQEEVKE